MKTKPTALTLKNIGDLIDQKLVPVLGELDNIKDQIVRLEDKVDEGFANVYDGLENLGRTIDKNIEPRLNRLEDRVFAH